METFLTDAAAAPTPVHDMRHLRVGETVDGFHLEEALPPGGMASFWRVTHPDFALPLIMKVPLLRG
jgi:eukaryotic-like serine/threonine-protein kinase